ncbi:MAG: TonB family protein [Candidatus Eisenbacteria bacterium]|nr:TonB family protein [Candidatus Eisenbacteria bacterium]
MGRTAVCAYTANESRAAWRGCGIPAPAHPPTAARPRVGGEAMRDATWYRAAHQRFRARHRRHFHVALLGALILLGLLALFSPPYVPSPYEPVVADPIQLEPPPEYEIPAKPAEIPTPQMPRDIDPFEGPGPEDRMPTQLQNPMVPVPRAGHAAPSAAPAVFEEPPAVVRRVAPVYPEIARLAQAEGSVAIGVSIDRNGRVVSAWVEESDTIESLEAAALQAARQFLFTPCRQSDVAVPCQIVLRFTFVIDESR